MNVDNVDLILCFLCLLFIKYNVLRSSLTIAKTEIGLLFAYVVSNIV